MSGRFLKMAEKIIKKQKGTQIRQMLEHYSVPMVLFLPVENVQSKVYGEESGINNSEPIEILGIATSDDFFASGPSNSGSFIEGYLYTTDERVVVGGTLDILGGDGRTRRYKIDFREAVGMTTDAFSRYKILALAGAVDEP